MTTRPKISWADCQPGCGQPPDMPHGYPCTYIPTCLHALRYGSRPAPDRNVGGARGAGGRRCGGGGYGTPEGGHR